MNAWVSPSDQQYDGIRTLVREIARLRVHQMDLAATLEDVTEDIADRERDLAELREWAPEEEEL